MVERRLQMLMTSWRPDARAASAFLSSEPSTNGPFQTERTMSGVPYFFRLWRLMRMNLLVDLLERVFLPLVGLPHGVTGWRPPEVRPSPPPCGWSTGFMVTPRLCGRLPRQTVRPALPSLMLPWSGLDTAPTVAMHEPCTTRCSPELRRRIAMPWPRPTSWP